MFDEMVMVATLIDVYSLVVLVAVVVSWLQLPPDNPIVKATGALTEPVLRPLRRVVPTFGGLDFTPMLLLIGLRIVRSLLI